MWFKELHILTKISEFFAELEEVLQIGLYLFLHYEKFQKLFCFQFHRNYLWRDTSCVRMKLALCETIDCIDNFDQQGNEK